MLLLILLPANFGIRYLNNLLLGITVTLYGATMSNISESAANFPMNVSE